MKTRKVLQSQFLHSDSPGQLHTPAAVSAEEELQFRPGKEAAWTPQPVSIVRLKEKSLATDENQTSAVHPIACHCND
jgi:hypothetical protein